jgi:hypothetical protein
MTMTKKLKHPQTRIPEIPGGLQTRRVPEVHLVTDSGLDCVSESVKLLVSDLIKSQPPSCPTTKPALERLFRSFNLGTWNLS